MRQHRGWVDFPLSLPLTFTLTLPPLLTGCSTPQQRLAHADWERICAYAPHTAGQPIDTLEQRAMSRLGLWHLSVAELDQQCRTRK